MEESSLGTAPQLPDKSIEEVARLMEESSLGTPGARQLRDRVPFGVAAAIRARAYFGNTDTGRAWWEANQNNPCALRRMARVLAAGGDLDISDVLTSLADRQEKDASLGGTAGQASYDASGIGAGWHTFGPFYRREFEPLSRILCVQADLPWALGTKLTGQAMVKAFDDWEHVAASADPREWVLGCALQLLRSRQLRDEDGFWGPAGSTSSASGPVSSTRSTTVLETDVRVTGALAVAASQVPLTSDAVGWTADQAVTILYSKCYRQLVRLVALLVDDVASAEEIVQDAFVAMHGEWSRLNDTGMAVTYLRRAVVNRTRSVLRHRPVIKRNFPKPPVIPDAGQSADSKLERSAVITALRSLPLHQREAIVLRYYADLSEEEIAKAMGISRRAVRSQTAYGMASLRAVLE